MGSVELGLRIVKTKMAAGIAPRSRWKGEMHSNVRASKCGTTSWTVG